MLEQSGLFGCRLRVPGTSWPRMSTQKHSSRGSLLSVHWTGLNSPPGVHCGMYAPRILLFLKLLRSRIHSLGFTSGNEQKTPRTHLKLLLKLTLLLMADFILLLIFKYLQQGQSRDRMSWVCISGFFPMILSVFLCTSRLL